jgi:hypothetical protein
MFSLMGRQVLDAAPKEPQPNVSLFEMSFSTNWKTLFFVAIISKWKSIFHLQVLCNSFSISDKRAWPKVCCSRLAMTMTTSKSTTLLIGIFE